MTKHNYRTFEAPAAVLLITVLLLAPYVGGQGELIGAGTLSILSFLAAGFLLWSRGAARPVGLGFWIAFVAISALSAVTTVGIHATMQQTIYFAGCAAAALAASSVFRGTKWLAAAIAGISLVGIVLGCMAVLDYLNEGGTWRVFGTFQNPGFFGGYLALIIPLTLTGLIGLWPGVCRWLTVRIGREAGLVVAALLLILALAALTLEWVAVFLTGTRVAILAAGVAVLPIILIGLVVGVMGSRRTLVATVLAVLLPAIVVGTFARKPTEARIHGPGAAEQAHSGPFRVATWKGTLRMIGAHPVLGTGAGTFDLAFPRYRIAGPTTMAHSGYLQVASDVGIPGLLVLAAASGLMVLAGFRGIRASRDDEQNYLGRHGALIVTCGLVGAVAAGLIRNVSDSDIFNAGIGFTFWAIMGMLAARAPERKESGRGIPARVGLTVVLLGLAALQYTLMLGQLKYDSGETAIREGRMGDAVSDYESGAAVDPLRADFWLRLGQLKVSYGGSNEVQMSESIDDIRRAADLEPTHARNYIVLGRMLAECGQKQQAIQAYLQAIDADPHALPAMLAIARLSTGARSEEMYRKVLSLENTPSETLRGVPEAVTPDYAWAHYYFGKNYLGERRWANSAMEFKAAIDRLEKRKSFNMYLTAMKEVGLVDPEEDKVLEKLLADCKAGLRSAEAGMREGRRNSVSPG